MARVTPERRPAGRIPKLSLAGWVLPQPIYTCWWNDMGLRVRLLGKSEIAGGSKRGLLLLVIVGSRLMWSRGLRGMRLRISLPCLHGELLLRLVLRHRLVVHMRHGLVT
jgi:hypothetical protein